MSISCRSIPMASILFSNEWNLHPWELDGISIELEKSFAQIGIIHPPIVLQSSQNEKYTIINGYKRLLWAKNNTSKNSIDCLLIKHDAPLIYVLNALLTDHLTSSSISLAEKARFIKIASRFLSEETIKDNYLLQLQLSKKRNAILETLEVLKQDESIIKEIHAGRLQGKMVSEILKLRSEQDCLALVDLFKNLCLGDGKQRRIFSLIRDIAFREDSSIADFLEKRELQEILKHQEMNNPQKAQHLATLLQDRLTPNYHKAEEQFKNDVKELQLPTNCTISHVPAFEKDEITLSITFKSLEECKKWLPNLKNTLNPDF